MFGHRNGKDRCGEDSGDPEALSHVVELRVFVADFQRVCGLQRHAADRTGIGAFAPDFRIHRTDITGGVLYAPGRGRHRPFIQKFAWIGDELFGASGAAEIITLTFVISALRRRRLCRIDGHPADGVCRWFAICVERHFVGADLKKRNCRHF